MFDCRVNHMNFMNQQNWLRLIAAALCVSVGVSVFSGCAALGGSSSDDGSSSHETEYVSEDTDTADPAAYTFTPKFNADTTCSKVNEANYIDVKNAELSDFGSISEFQNIYWSKITPDNQNAEIGIRYNNVGTYEGSVIDMELAVKVGYLCDAETQKAALGAFVGKPNTGNEYYQTPVVGFYYNDIGIAYSFPAIGNLTYLCKFYDHDTGEAANIKSKISLTGICGGDTVIALSGIDTAEVGEHLTASGNMYASMESCSHGKNYIDIAVQGSVTEDVQEHWVTMYASGSSFSFYLEHEEFFNDSDPYTYLHEMGGLWYVVMNQFFLHGSEE